MLYMNQFDLYKSELTICGWGQTKRESNKMSEILLKATIKYMDDLDCQDYYNGKPNVYLPRGILITQFCGLDRKFNSDTCYGDSGSPVQIKHDNEVFVIGITSFGPPICGDPNYPGVYTDIKSFLKWIEDNTGIKPGHKF